MNAKPQPKIAFIGAGNMGGAIISGLIKQGYAVSNLRAAGPRAESLHKLAQATGIEVTTSNQQAAAWADVVVLAVKPQIMREVCLDLAAQVQRSKPLVLSLAAGITSELIQTWLGATTAVVRSMPNTPSLIGLGVAGLYANHLVTPEQKMWVEQLSQAVGQAFWVAEEVELDAVTAISGSGPAYYFLFTEALAAAGEKLGLSPDLALNLAKATAAGAGQLLMQSTVSPAELRRQVTSPGGTTEQAVQKFIEQDLHELVSIAAQAAACRAAELAEEQKINS